jgi:hypothetical protein
VANPNYRKQSHSFIFLFCSKTRYFQFSTELITSQSLIILNHLHLSNHKHTEHEEHWKFEYNPHLQ